MLINLLLLEVNMIYDILYQYRQQPRPYDWAKRAKSLDNAAQFYKRRLSIQIQLLLFAYKYVSGFLFLEGNMVVVDVLSQDHFMILL